MARDVLVRIKGSDELSPVFEDVGQAASDAASDIGDIKQPLDEAGDAADTAKKKFEGLDGDIKNIGLAVGILGGAAALSGQKYRDHNLEADKMARIYGDMADAMESLVDSLGGDTLFGESDLVKGINEFGTLVSELDLTQLENLADITADLAAVNNTSFADAADKIAKGLLGQAEGLRDLGVELDGDNVLSRYNELLGDAAFAQGAAADQTKDWYGWLTQQNNALAINAREMGGLLGVLGEVGAFTADNALQLGLMGAGFYKVTEGAIGLHRVLGARGLAGGLMGPGGLVVGLLAAQLAFEGLRSAFTTDFASDAEGAVESFNAITDSIREMEDGANLTAAQGVLGATAARIAEEAAANQQLIDAYKDGWLDVNLLTDAQRDLIDINEDGTISAKEAAQAQYSLNDARKEGAELNAFYADIGDEVAFALKAEGDGAADLALSINALIEKREAGTLSTNDAVSSIESLVAAYKEEELASRLGSERIPATMAEMAALADVINYQEQMWQGAADKGIFYYLARANEIPEMEAALQQALISTNEIMDDRENNWAGNNGRAEEYLAHVREVTEALERNRDAAVSNFSQIETALTSSTDALTTGFRVIVSNTDALATQTQGVENWIVALGESRNVLEEIGIIQSANALIQEAVLDIQAQQAPLIAALTAEQAVFMEQLRDMPADLQLVALGFMDTTLSAQAMELAMLPFSGMGADMFVPMIENAARADPVLRAMLESIGLINVEIEEIDGETVATITVNTEGALSPMQELSDAINNLTITLFEVFIGGDPEGAMGAVEDARAALDGVDGETATVNINAVDGASATIAAIERHLAGMDGRSATVYVNTVSSFRGSSFSPLGNADGGVIPRMADGGVAVLGAEVGREMVRRGDGGISFMDQPGIYNLSAGDMVIPAPATRQLSSGASVSVSVSVNGNVYGMDELNKEVAAALVPALVGAIEDRERANL